MNGRTRKVNVAIGCGMTAALTFLAWFYARQRVTAGAYGPAAPFCAADLMVNGFNSWCGSYLALALVLVDTMLIVRNDFRYANLIVYGSRGRLWKKQCERLAAHAAGYGGYYMLCTLFFALRFTDVRMNWSYTDSYFFRSQKMVLSTGFATVLLAFTAVCILCWLIVGLGYLLFDWLTGNAFLVWLLVLLIRFVMYQVVKINLMGSISYQSWIAGTVWQSVIGMLPLAAGICTAGFFIAKKREFCSERK